MKFQVKLFAGARDAASAEQVEVELPNGARLSDLRTALAEQFPALAGFARSAMFAVNARYADGEATLAPSDEVACIPPVSGG